ncbi:heparan-alpha-glucosaminide N-acetyltransferase [Echinicola strongylocentroti]|uniref:Heparan-alpha-glucosaminide N-acetyltransferase n=2 Tax=Echinicola strongylocentroti TaxID=1795355 RepID=A0A2Z4ID60_9BACT|nr:heparan-alpha-glucosaminide N-acetyltransferase [Echinicola strongylocentroti]
MKEKGTRLISLDALRGATIAAMILVNFPGSWDSVFPPLLHAHWNGITPTDFIFPFFLFIVGVSIALAYSKSLSNGLPKRDLYKKTLIRGVKIFVLGVVLGMIPQFDFADIRVAGVLQRISIVFVVCSFLFLQSGWRSQVFVMTFILIGYWLTMVLIPDPVTGEVMLEPGDNVAAWIDLRLLPGKMWNGNWDPEGIYSTLPAVATGILGMLAGKLLLSDKDKIEKAAHLMVMGFALTLLGLFWSLFFPLNKNLWTSSYVLVTAGVAFGFLGAFYYWVDVKGNRWGTKPWIIFGSNAITVYVLADVLSLLFYVWLFDDASLSAHFMEVATDAGMMPELASMVFATMFVAVNFVPAYLLYQRRIFIKL